jgi:hypothetical protein
MAHDVEASYGRSGQDDIDQDPRRGMFKNPLLQRLFAPKRLLYVGPALRTRTVGLDDMLRNTNVDAPQGVADFDTELEAPSIGAQPDMQVYAPLPEQQRIGLRPPPFDTARTQAKPKYHEATPGGARILDMLAHTAVGGPMDTYTGRHV